MMKNDDGDVRLMKTTGSLQEISYTVNVCFNFQHDLTLLSNFMFVL